MQRQTSSLDRFVAGFDNALRTLSGQQSGQRPSPAADLPDVDLDEAHRQHAAGLMRVNHTGEICAQALYEGQALLARNDEARDALLAAASEERDHLAWCRQRLGELQSQPSQLDPLFYAASFGLGALAGLAGDRVSLGFVEATEAQVVAHLDGHLEELPADDARSRAIVEQMRCDEAEHGAQALARGGAEFPRPVKEAMSAVSKLMTWSTYRI